MSILVSRAAALAALALLATGAGGTSAQASEGLYCAQESGRNGYTNCGYYTFEQCRAAISGVGGFCMQNPAVRAYSIEDTYYRPRRIVIYR